jgi:hypothetical protein
MSGYRALFVANGARVAPFGCLLADLAIRGIGQR